MRTTIATAALLLSLALVGSRAWAAPQLVVHVAVLSDPRDGAEGALDAERVGLLLQGSGAWVVTDRAMVEARLGEQPGAVLRDCGMAERCWRALARRAGVDVLVMVERVDASTLGVRAVEASGTGPVRVGMAPLLAAGWPDPALVETLFLGEGHLQLSGVPDGAVLHLDDRPPEPLTDGRAIGPVPAGKHGVEVVAEGFEPWFVAVYVPPNDTVGLEVALEPVRAERPVKALRWSSGAAVGLTAGVLVLWARGARPLGEPAR